jgi:hypothetical protein
VDVDVDVDVATEHQATGHGGVYRPLHKKPKPHPHPHHNHKNKNKKSNQNNEQQQRPTLQSTIDLRGARRQKQMTKTITATIAQKKRVGLCLCTLHFALRLRCRCSYTLHVAIVLLLPGLFAHLLLQLHLRRMDLAAEVCASYFDYDELPASPWCLLLKGTAIARTQSTISHRLDSCPWCGKHGPMLLEAETHSAYEVLAEIRVY